MVNLLSYNFLKQCEFAVFLSICQLVSVDLKMRTIWKKREVAAICRILAGFFLAKILFSLVQLNLSTAYSLHLCPCFVQQFSSSSRRWEKLDPTPYVRIMQLIDHKVCRSSFVRLSIRSFAARSLVRSFARSLVRSFARRSANSLFLLLEQICYVQLPKFQANGYIHLSLIENHNLRAGKSLKSIVNMLLLKSPSDVFLCSLPEIWHFYSWLLCCSMVFRKIKEILAFYLKNNIDILARYSRGYFYNVFLTEWEGEAWKVFILYRVLMQTDSTYKDSFPLVRCNNNN